ncbi:RING-CH-type domain-containing protein [Raphanus sativus]|nr:RING-CH-type domain-containing protein [Raphanus sativus]
MQGEVQLQPPDSQNLSDSAPLLGNTLSSSSSSSSSAEAESSDHEINAEDDLESGGSASLSPLVVGCAFGLLRCAEFRNSFNDDWDRILSKRPIPFYYCIGVVTFFVLTGFLVSFYTARLSTVLTRGWLGVRTAVTDG